MTFDFTNVEGYHSVFTNEARGTLENLDQEMATGSIYARFDEETYISGQF